MEKYISILLFINAVFFFQPNKGNNHTNHTKGNKGKDYLFFGNTCNIHTEAKCRDACSRTFEINGRFVRCCQGGGDSLFGTVHKHWSDLSFALHFLKNSTPFWCKNHSCSSKTVVLQIFINEEMWSREQRLQAELNEVRTSIIIIHSFKLPKLSPQNSQFYT